MRRRRFPELRWLAALARDVCRGRRSRRGIRGGRRVIDLAPRGATIASMIDLVLSDEQNPRVQLGEEIPTAAATVLLPFRGVW